MIILAIVFIVMAGIKGSFVFFLIGIGFAVIILILTQSYNLSDVNLELASKMFKVPDTIPENEVLEHYTEDKIKKMMVEYKVKKDHRMVIVDTATKLKIFQAPAYMWLQGGKLNLLIIEREPRVIVIPISRIDKITYKANVLVNVDSEYVQFRKTTPISYVFSPYLPDYSGGDRKYKNLYFICDEIGFTNNSMKQVFDFVHAEFVVDDSVTNNKLNNKYFVKAYQYGILLKDRAISVEAYKARMSRLLEDMTVDEMPNSEFENTMINMLRQRLVTEEFAAYYTGQRNKVMKKGK